MLHKTSMRDTNQSAPCCACPTRGFSALWPRHTRPCHSLRSVTPQLSAVLSPFSPRHGYLRMAESVFKYMYIVYSVNIYEAMKAVYIKYILCFLCLNLQHSKGKWNLIQNKLWGSNVYGMLTQESVNLNSI